jgi:hypothetical protein
MARGAPIVVRWPGIEVKDGDFQELLGHENVATTQIDAQRAADARFGFRICFGFRITDFGFWRALG